MKKLKAITSLILAVATLALFSPASRADETVVYEEIVAGFLPHVQCSSGGNIDWTAGCILAKGHGFAEGTNNQQQLLARRAAVVDAAANALAIAAGIDVDAHGRAGGLRNGRRRIEGCVKGQQIIDETWTPALVPPRYDVTMRVPLWGVNSVATLFRDDCAHRMTQVESKRMPLVLSDADVSGAVLVIDARGTGLNPCLFPIVAADDGATLYNVTAIAAGAVAKPPVRYVESDLSFERIRAAVERGDDLPGLSNKPAARLASSQPADQTPNVATNGIKQADDTTSNGNKDDDPKDDSQPQRKRRRRAVRAVKADGNNNTKIVLTAEDADKLRKDAEGANLLRNADIVVVVDSAAAGIQGRNNAPPAKTMLAYAPAR